MFLARETKQYLFPDGTILRINREGTAFLVHVDGQTEILNEKRSRFLACLSDAKQKYASYSELNEAYDAEFLPELEIKKKVQDFKNNLKKHHPVFRQRVEVDGKLREVIEQVRSGYRLNCEEIPHAEPAEDAVVRNLRLRDDRESFAQSGNVLLASRGEIEQRFTLEHSFGCEIIRWVREQKAGFVDYTAYQGPQPVKEIFFFGGAGVTLFEPAYSAEVQYRDRLAVQFPELLKVFLVDPAFFLDVILTEPGSPGAVDGIRFHRLGNEKFAGSPGTTFTASVTELDDLLWDRRSAYSLAQSEHRLSIRLTEMAIPYAVLGVRYKPEYKEAWGFEDYVKVDLYSENITHPKTRPSMVIFEGRNKAMFDFFSEKFMSSKHDQFSRDLDSYSEELKAEWRREWEEFKRRMPRK